MDADSIPTHGRNWSTDIILVIALLIMLKVTKWYYTRVMNEKHKTAVLAAGAKRKQERDQEVQHVLDEYEAQFPSQERRRLIVVKYNSLKALRKGLDKKELTSKELVLTYVYKAATKGLELNALADVMFKTAIEEAEKCDEELRRGTKRGFLHGIPVSFKEQFIIANTVCTLGT